MFETYSGTAEWERLGCDEWIDAQSVSKGLGGSGKLKGMPVDDGKDHTKDLDEEDDGKDHTKDLAQEDDGKDHKKDLDKDDDGKDHSHDAEVNWTQCAGENGFCKCDNEIFYGHALNGKPNFDRGHKEMDAKKGGRPCTNGEFGDPLRGTYKHCFCSSVAEPAPEIDWTFCADEGGHCACEADIWYGAEGSDGKPDEKRGHT